LLCGIRDIILNALNGILWVKHGTTACTDELPDHRLRGILKMVSSAAT
jgi:hypothetical protein